MTKNFRSICLQKVHYLLPPLQCDQMARLFAKYLVIYINENLPNCIKNSPKYGQILANAKPLKITKELKMFA